MATTVEITVGMLLLLVNTFCIAILYFVGNAILTPILAFAASFPIHESLKASMWETSYIYPSIIGLLLIFEFIIIVGFVYILARRQVTPFEY